MENALPPLIGITAANAPNLPGHYILRWDYVDGIEAAGGIPVILAPSTGAKPKAVLSRLDGVLLSGGGDISPQMYGGEQHPLLTDTSLERDEFEFGLTELALKEQIPMLGICRGMQVLNLALGGGLIQHLPERVGSGILHDDPARPRDCIVHDVVINGDSHLHRLLHTRRLAVNSFHHQAVDNPGRGIHVTAVADDGVIEGIELTDHPFALGIQWHPEALFRQNRIFSRFFDALVAAAIEGRAERGG